MEAYEVCDRLNLIRPICEQPVYNLLERERMEKEYLPFFDRFNMGTTIYSPLAGGFLTGKLLKEIPKDSRTSSNPVFKSIFYDPYMTETTKETSIARIKGLQEIAKELKCTISQLAIAWTLKNQDVSTTLIGTANLKQLEENVIALKLYKSLSPEILEKIEKVFNNRPQPQINWRTGTLYPPRR